MIRTRKVKYFTDKDGQERTNKSQFMMSKKDISLICNLYNIQNISPTNIYNRKNIRHGYRKIKKLLDSLENLRRPDNTFPEDLEE